jgi:hypothetical protein
MFLSKFYPNLLLAGLMAILLGGFSGDDMKKPLVDFLPQDWKTCQNYALQQGKLYFVQFTAAWSDNCLAHDQTIYRDRALVDYMSKHVVAHKVNVDDFVDDGYRWTEQYEVEYLPTILLFDEKGKLVERLEGLQQTGELLKVLQKYRGAAPTAGNKLPNPPDVVPTPLPNTGSFAQYETSRPIQKTEQNDGAYKPFNAPTPKPKPVVRPTGNMAAPSAPGQYKVYDLALEKGPQNGFGLQVGLFAEYDNVIATAERIKKSMPELQRFWVVVDNSGPKPAYRLFFGHFQTEPEAQAASGRYRSKGIATLVKRYDNPAL